MYNKYNFLIISELWHNEWKDDLLDVEVLQLEDQESLEELENQQNQDYKAWYF